MDHSIDVGSSRRFLRQIKSQAGSQQILVSLHMDFDSAHSNRPGPNQGTVPVSLMALQKVDNEEDADARCHDGYRLLRGDAGVISGAVTF